MKKLNLTWLKAAAVRAVKTMAQTALGMVTVGAAISDINWKQVASVAVVAGVFSLLTSLAGLPETDTQSNNALLPSAPAVPTVETPTGSAAPVSQTDPVNPPATDIPVNPDPQNGTSQK